MGKRTRSNKTLRKNSRRSLQRNKNKNKNKKSFRRFRGGFPQPSSPILGGGIDTRYTINQPVTNMLESGQYSVTNMFKDLMGWSRSTDPSVLNQPYLEKRLS